MTRVAAQNASTQRDGSGQHWQSLRPFRSKRIYDLEQQRRLVVAQALGELGNYGFSGSRRRSGPRNDTQRQYSRAMSKCSQTSPLNCRVCAHIGGTPRILLVARAPDGGQADGQQIRSRSRRISLRMPEPPRRPPIESRIGCVDQPRLRHLSMRYDKKRITTTVTLPCFSAGSLGRLGFITGWSFAQ